LPGDAGYPPTALQPTPDVRVANDMRPLEAQRLDDRGERVRVLDNAKSIP